MYVRRTVTIYSNVGAYNISVDTDEEKSRPNMLLSYHDNMHYNSVHDQANNVNSINNNHQDVSIQTNSRKKEKTKKKQNRNEYSDETKTNNNVLEFNDVSNGHEDPSEDKDQSLQQQISKKDYVAEDLKKKNVQRKNDICSCGSG